VPDAIASQAPGFEQALLVQPSAAAYKPAPGSIWERRATSFEQNPDNAATPGEQREPGYYNVTKPGNFGDSAIRAKVYSVASSAPLKCARSCFEERSALFPANPVAWRDGWLVR